MANRRVRIVLPQLTAAGEPTLLSVRQHLRLPEPLKRRLAHQFSGAHRFQKCAQVVDAGVEIAMTQRVIGQCTLQLLLQFSILAEIGSGHSVRRQC
ncbi:hypothetical protein EYC54_08380 [Xanthomonas oryzae]|nr:hypothetical protein EYC54_08380 [Xanthomonas oryzae]QBG91585.1 hypothetical protein EYR26_08130 [Xanthomonas oryzae]